MTDQQPAEPAAEAPTVVIIGPDGQPIGTVPASALEAAQAALGFAG